MSNISEELKTQEAITQQKKKLDIIKANYLRLKAAAEVMMATDSPENRQKLESEILDDRLDAEETRLSGVLTQADMLAADVGNYTADTTTSPQAAATEAKLTELTDAMYLDPAAKTETLEAAMASFRKKVEAFLKNKPMTETQFDDILNRIEPLNDAELRLLIVGLARRVKKLESGQVAATQPATPEQPPAKTQKQIDDEEKAEEAAHKKELDAAKKEVRNFGSWKFRQKALLNPDLQLVLRTDLDGLLELFSVKVNQLPTEDRLATKRRKAVLPILILAKELGVITSELPTDVDQNTQGLAADLKDQLNIADEVLGGKIDSQRMKVLKLWLLQHKQQLLDVAELQGVRPADAKITTTETAPPPPENFAVKNKAALKTAYAETEVLFAGLVDDDAKINVLNVPKKERKAKVDAAYTKFEAAIAAGATELKIEANDKEGLAMLILASDPATKFKPDAGNYAKTAAEIKTLLDRINA